MDLTLKTCAHCGNDFLPRRRWSIYCSPACNKAAYYARRHPANTPRPDAERLDFSLDGPTPEQEADRERRKSLKEEPEHRAAEVMEAMERERQLQQNPTLGDLGYAPPAYHKPLEEMQKVREAQKQSKPDEDNKPE